MKITEIKTNEYAIYDIDERAIVTKNLEGDIAFTCISSELLKAGVARNLSNENLDKFFDEFGLKNATKPISVRILGGDTCEESKKACHRLIKRLQYYDGERNVIDIIAFDVREKIHPNSFVFSCSSGFITAL